MTETLEYKIEAVDPQRLKLLDQNARYMTHEQFARLVENVRRDGCLTSVPLVHKDENGEMTVLSGNHRTKAAREVGLETIHVMILDQPLEEARRIAVQLSHNSINGQDDPAVLKELWEQIDDVDWREFAALDDRQLKLLDEVKPGSLSEANLDFQTVTIAFLPEELERLKAAFEDAAKLARSADETWAAPLGLYDRFVDALDMAGRAMSVTNQATAMALVLEVFYAHLTDLREHWRAEQGDRQWIPVPSVAGWEMPQSAADVVGQAIDRMTARGEISHPWQALELLAADYLAGN